MLQLVSVVPDKQGRMVKLVPVVPGEQGAYAVVGISGSR